jgi:phage baseplate assembly protein W
MASYIGFSTKTINQVRDSINIQTGTDGGSAVLPKPFQASKTFKLIDEQLVVNDFINSLNIPQGQKIGNPGYGTNLWSFIFEPNTIDVQRDLTTEIKRMAALDSRIDLNSVNVSAQDSGILIELEMAIIPFNNALNFSVFFDSLTNTAFGS